MGSFRTQDTLTIATKNEIYRNEPNNECRKIFQRKEFNLLLKDMKENLSKLSNILNVYAWAN